MIWPNPFRFLASICFSLWGRLRGYEILATTAETKERLGKCYECEYIEGGWEPQCKICTCFIDAKAMLALEQCPKKKWLRIWRKINTIKE